MLAKLSLTALLAALLLALSPGAAPAQMGRDSVSVEVLAPTTPCKPGGRYSVTIRLVVPPGLHINSEAPEDPSMVPTSVSLVPDQGIRFSPLVFPPAVLRQLPFMEMPLGMLEGVVDVKTIMSVSQAALPGKHQITALVRYQACDDAMCLLPETQKVPFTVQVSN